MAVIQPNIQAVGGQSVLITWGPFAGATDVCAPVEVSRFSDKTFAVVVGAGAWTGSLKGANRVDMAGEVDMTDADNVGGPQPINNTFIGSGATQRMAVVRENPLMMRPVTTAGTGLVLALCCR